MLRNAGSAGAEFLPDFVRAAGRIKLNGHFLFGFRTPRLLFVHIPEQQLTADMTDLWEVVRKK